MILNLIKIIEIEFDKEYRSPGWDRYQKKIKCLNGKNK